MYVYVKGGYRSGVKGAIRILPRAKRAKICSRPSKFLAPRPKLACRGAPDKGVELKLVRGGRLILKRPTTPPPVLRLWRQRLRWGVTFDCYFSTNKESPQEKRKLKNIWTQGYFDVKDFHGGALGWGWARWGNSQSSIPLFVPVY